jgi:hypothetical protein
MTVADQPKVREILPELVGQLLVLLVSSESEQQEVSHKNLWALPTDS